MNLLDFPTELLNAIVQHIESEADLNALVQTNRGLYYIFNSHLYSVNAQFFTGSALLWAVQNNLPQTAHYALQNGVEELLDWDREPLHCAVEQGNEAMISLLLEYGAGVDCKRFDNTPLYVAAGRGHEGVVSLLLQHGAYLESNNTEVILSRYNTPLHIAAYCGNTAIVKLLLEKGANIEAENSNGDTPLFQALYALRHETFWFLIDNNAKFQGDDASRTALSEAVDLGDLEIVKGLLERGANPNFYNEPVYSPVYRAATNNRLDLLRLLLDKGADIDMGAAIGSTALNFCIHHGREFAVQMLLDCGADPNARSNEGSTPMHYAATKDTDSMTKALIEKGADLEAVNNHGQTPLFFAVLEESEQNVRLLLQHGCDRYKRLEDGRTIWDIAAWQARDSEPHEIGTKILNLLREG